LGRGARGGGGRERETRLRRGIIADR